MGQTIATMTEWREELKKSSPLKDALAVRKGLIVVVLFPFLDLVDDLIKCNQVCRGFHELIDPKYRPVSVNYINMFSDQGSVICLKA